LRRLHDEINLTSVFVTHDQEEALEVADRVVVVNHGRIEQVGTPDEVYDHPATPFVYEFLGNVNLFEGRVHNGIADVGGGRIHAPEHGNVADSAATAYVRPHDIDIASAAGKDRVEATLNHATRIGSVVRLELSRKDNGAYVEVELSRERFEHLNVSTGNVVHFKPRHARVFLADRSHSNAA
jgi:sulfate transport system ATP-binding protein